MAAQLLEPCAVPGWKSPPVAWAGVWVGQRAHRLAPATAARIIAAALFMAGTALIARSL